MKSARSKVSMIYVLTGIVLLLIIYLVLFTYKSLKPEETKKQEESSGIDMPKVAASCTFDMTASEFDNIDNAENLCSTLNRINITGVSVEGTEMKIIVFYRPDTETKNTGIYINDAVVNEVANESIQYKFTSMNDRLFITTIMEGSANLVAYNKNVMPVYNLAETLNSLQIQDQVLNTVLGTNNIDGESISINDEGVSFNSTSGTCTNGVSGVNYTIKYTGNTFENPVAGINVTC